MKTEYTVLGKVEISATANIKSGSILGKKYRRFLDGTFEEDMTTYIEDNVEIGHNCIIGNGSRVGINTVIDDNSSIESNVVIGDNSLIIYSSQICSHSHIGNNCIIGGFIGERTQIGNNCRIFGKIVHSQHNPLNPWDDDSAQENAPIIGNNVFMGFNSIITAPISVNNNVYICAGSIISISVPEFHIAFGVNQLVHFSNWKGNLRNSNLFKND